MPEDLDLEQASILLETLEISEIQEFQENVVWIAFKGYLQAGIIQSQNVLETAADMEIVREAQGRIAELRSLHDLTDVIKEQLKVNKETAEK